MADFMITQKNQSSKVRTSGVELLRCLAIFFVVVIHEIPAFLDSSNLFVFLSRIVAWPAIFCFSFITGYFLITQSQSEKKIKNFLRLTLEIVIWRILIATIVLLILSFTSGDNFWGGFADIFWNLIDVKSWYFWAIIFVYLVFPFFTNYLNQNYQTGKKLLMWIMIFLLFISLLATIASYISPSLGYNFWLYTNQYTFIIVLTSATLGAYWHLIEQERKIVTNWKWQVFGLIGLLGAYLLNFTGGWWGKDQDAALSYLNILWYFSGFFYFLIFKNFHFQSKFVNWWASLSWWIYLLHNGNHLPRGGARRIIALTELDPYTATILTILLCYFLTIGLVLITQNFDKYIIKNWILIKLRKNTESPQKNNS